MNRLSLERRVYVHEPQRDSPGCRIEMVVPIIDGTPLCEMVEDRDEGLDIAFFDPPSRQWLGEPTYAVGGRAVILDGGCGIAECCGVVARITLTEDRVIWSHFVAGGQPPLPEGLHFEFDRSQYEAVVTNLASAPERRWSSGDATHD